MAQQLLCRLIAYTSRNQGFIGSSFTYASTETAAAVVPMPTLFAFVLADARDSIATGFSAIWERHTRNLPPGQIQPAA